MKPYPFICLLLLFFSLTLDAQRNCKIVYKGKMIASRDAWTQFAEKERRKKFIEEGQNVDSMMIADSANIAMIAETMATSLGLEGNVTMEEVYKEKNYIVSRGLKDPVKGRIYKKFDLETFTMVVIDSFVFHRFDSVQITVVPPDELPKKQYTAEATKAYRVINGYKCRQFLITVKSLTSDERQNNFYEVWATKDIKPALSVYGVLRLGEKIFKDYTPLLIKEFMDKEIGIYAETSVASLQWY